MLSILVLICSSLIAIYLYSGPPNFLNNESESQGTVTKLGCRFLTDGYDLSHPVGGKVEGKTLEEKYFPAPVWGEGEGAMELTSESELEDLIERIGQIHREVLENIHYNSVDNYLQFYEDYKRSGLDFHTFYAGYRPTFRPHENCIGLAIEVLERLHTHLTPRWPHLARYTYLASCWMDISAEWINQVEGKITEEIDTRGLPRSGLQHVLGALQINVQGRRGYILIDQGFALESPIVLMLDGMHPHNHIVQRNDFDNFNEYKLIGKDLVHWRIFRNSTVQILEQHLINVKRPYCSFLSITEKRDLVRPLRSMVRTNRRGQIEGGFFFEATAPSSNISPAVMVIWSNEDYRSNEDYKIYLEDIVENEQDDGILSELEDMDQILGYDSGVTLSKLLQLKSVLRDEQFVRGCVELHEALENITQHRS
ncbi:hypothetical protein M8J76_009047 [Diaphorina citri]|nr:hypothetical protein M8J76_009047 [Diaphorina citri]